MRGNRWLLSVLVFASASALGANYRVGIGDVCDSNSLTGCFTPSQLTVNVGDTVTFYGYADTIATGPHNVVADDGSFRCARGCDGEGGDGTPVSGERCNFRGCGYDPALQLGFSRQFDVPGVVGYHDEVSLAAGVIIVQEVPPVAIGPGVTGTWFNPAQSGQGFELEVLPGSPMQLLASWFTFAPQGGPSWIVGLGPVDGNRAVLQASQPAGSGARFPPNFDPANVHDENWGTLTFTFSDCDHGHVDWASTAPGYGSGGMDIARLTLPAGLVCLP